jgi:hypothetical protein
MRVTTRHHHIRVDIINNREVRTVDPILVDLFGMKFIVPAHFKTDGASIPRILWWLYQPLNLDSLRGAIAHDYCYRVCKDIPRRWCDMVLFYMMKESGSSLFKCYTFYAMVRLFGWIPRNLMPFLKKLWFY